MNGTHLKTTGFVFEEDDGLEAGEFRRIDSDEPEALNQFAEEAQISGRLRRLGR